MSFLSKFKKASLPIKKAYVAKVYLASDFVNESDGPESSAYTQAVSDFLEDNPGESKSSFLETLYVQTTYKLYKENRDFKVLWDRVYGKMEVIERDYYLIPDKNVPDKNLNLNPDDLASMLWYYGIEVLGSELNKPLSEEEGRLFAVTEQYYPTKSKKPLVTAYVFFFDG